VSLKISYLTSRAGRLYFSRRIPDEFHELAGQREWKLSLGLIAGQEREASGRILELVSQTDAAMDRLAQGLPTKLTLRRSAQIDTHNLMTFSQAFELYCDHKKAVGKAEQKAYEQLLMFMGDPPLAEINRLTVRRWLEWLEAERRQAAPTIRRRLCSTRAIFNYAVDTLDLPFRNPCARQKVEGGPPIKRLPFHQTHLALMDRWIESKPADNHTALILRLLKGTSCRPLEIGGLASGDVSLDDVEPCIYVRSNERRRIKTLSSERMIPLVGDALTAAQIAFENERGGWLFAENCSQTELLSLRLNKAIRAAGIPKTPSLTAYSFRHTFVEAMRRADVRPEIQRVLVGHQRQAMTERYGASRYDYSDLRTGIEQAHQRLGDVSLRHFEGIA